MQLIVEMYHGSRLYGTNTPQSDIDLTGVYLPEARDILLQRVQGVIVQKPSKAPGQKNAPGEIDRNIFSLQRYLSLLAEGQTIALEMLFAPESAMTMPATPLWREVQNNADRLISRRSKAFIGYCRRQANTYGVKGTRIAAARKALCVLEEAEKRLGGAAKLGEIAEELATLAEIEHIAFVDMPTPSGQQIRYLEVCNRKAPFTGSIKTAREVVQHLVKDYGQRALQAERDGGVDWKALSHAVRIGHEMIEFFSTGRITLPRPDASHLLRIKQGREPYEAVTDEIEMLLAEAEKAVVSTKLPEKPDQAFIDDLVARIYTDQVRAI